MSAVKIIPQPAHKATSADDVVVGPYSPIEGPDSIGFCGGLVALAASHQVDTAGIQPGDYGKIFEAKDVHGHTWYVRWIGTPLFVAFRERTEQELEDFNDENDSMVGVHFQKVRLVACRLVASELFELADELRPEICASRGYRRWLKRRMVALTMLQWNLLMFKPTSMKDLRQQLAEVNLRLPQRNHSERFGRPGVAHG